MQQARGLQLGYKKGQARLFFGLTKFMTTLKKGVHTPWGISPLHD